MQRLRVQQPEPLTAQAFGRRTDLAAGNEVSILRVEIADMGDRLRDVEHSIRELKSLLESLRGQEASYAPLAAAEDFRKPDRSSNYPTISPREPFRSPDRSEWQQVQNLIDTKTSSVLRDYNALVADKAADSAAFIQRYSVRGLEKDASSGQFRALSDPDSANIWAVPVGSAHPLWFVLPGRKMIRDWSYLSEMGGSGAIEYLHGAYEFSQSKDRTLFILSPAIANSGDGSLFRVTQQGKLSGVI